MNWSCASCKAANAGHRDRCLRCKSARPSLVLATIEASKPRALDGVLEGGASSTSAPGVCHWREALNVRTRQMYYTNTATGEVSWSRPAELGAAPLASGWFGVGSVSGGGAQGELAANNERWMQRPARKQADVDPSKLQRAEGANEYNVWWGKFIGDGWKGGMGKDPAPTLCIPERDAGWTKATLISLTERAYFCIHFARGGCAKGSACAYHHRIPTAEDDGALDPGRDVFGRERHTSHRDDMGGVGSMLSNCRTLYVGGVKRPPWATAAGSSGSGSGSGSGGTRPSSSSSSSSSSNHGHGMEGGGGAAPLPAPHLMAQWEGEVVSKFSVWGELEGVNIIPRLGVAFVRYRCRAAAEFALQSMANQSLGRGEVLNLRWAYDDPNPAAVAARERANESAVEAALAARGLSLVIQGPTMPPPPPPSATEEREEEGEKEKEEEKEEERGDAAAAATASTASVSSAALAEQPHPHSSSSLSVYYPLEFGLGHYTVGQPTPGIASYTSQRKRGREEEEGGGEGGE